MVSLLWCFRQNKGIEFVNPNLNMSKSYIKMAENSLGTMNRENGKNNSFSIVAGYYAMYSSLYSVLIRIGIKCEIHQCSLKLMEFLLKEFYSKEDIKNLSRAFKLRNIAQYYVDRKIERKDFEDLLDYAPEFVTKSKSVLLELNEDKIKEMRNKLKEFVKKPSLENEN